MSHITPIDILITDLDAVRTMCKQMGWEFCENQSTYKWYGEWLGIYSLPKGFSKEQLGKCDHAIRIPGASYEVGLVKKGEKYIVLFDPYEVGGLDKVLGGHKAPKFIQAYGIAKTKLAAQKRGFKVTQKKVKGGYKLCLTR